jgi:hypothetical protein
MRVPSLKSPPLDGGRLRATIELHFHVKDNTGPVKAGDHHRAIDIGDDIHRSRILYGDDLGDGLEAMLLVAGIDALGRIAKIEIRPLLETGGALQDRHATLLDGARIDRRFIDVAAGLQFPDTLGIDIKPDHPATSTRECGGHRQTDMAKSNDGKLPAVRHKIIFQALPDAIDVTSATV